MRRIAVITGTRAEWGLLESICTAIHGRTDLVLEIFAGGSHLVPPQVANDGITANAYTISEVEEWARTHDVRVRRFEMQRAGETGRFADALALGRGVTKVAELCRDADPDIVVVLGDRIEALAAASAAAIAGIRVAHIHGGDRAEGVADESIRHAITKLAHLHFAASPTSAARILRLGEDPSRVHLVGSPAIEGLTEIKSRPGDGSKVAPRYIFLMHPIGRDEADEEREARIVLSELSRRGRTLVLLPNLDPGREGIIRAIHSVSHEHADAIEVSPHLPRREFLSIVRDPGVLALVGNSSAGLIECAALGVRAVNIGSRQDGRERADNVRDVAEPTAESLATALKATLDTIESWTPSGRHPFGEGSPAQRIAAILGTAPLDGCPVRKRNAF